jgi:hypothetical protein
MKLLARIAFISSALLFCAFLFFVTERGQAILQGAIPANATGFQRDDIYMGAGLAPWTWMLAPSIILLLIALVMNRASKEIRSDRLSQRLRNSQKPLD